MVVFPEMRDVLRMRQILLACVLVVVLLEMVDLVFILVVAVVAGPDTEVGEATVPLIDVVEPLFAGDAAGIVFVVGIEDLVDDLLPALFAQVFVGLVVEAVEAPNFVRGPNAVVVEIVKDEEGSWVEIVDVMFL